MADGDGQRIRITLRWIKILDKLEPAWDEAGEFRFKARFSSENHGGLIEEVRFPEQGHYTIQDRPGWNFMELNRKLFEGEVEDHLVVEIFGVELDKLTPDDHLDTYRREFRGSPMDWLGVYKPHDEPEADDPERMSNWHLCYMIERG